MTKKEETEFNDLDMPHIISISWTEDEAMDVDSGDNMTPSEVLGALALAFATELVSQVADALGIDLPEGED